MMLLMVVAVLNPMKLDGGAMLRVWLCEGEARIAVRKLLDILLCWNREAAIVYELQRLFSFFRGCCLSDVVAGRQELILKQMLVGK